MTRCALRFYEGNNLLARLGRAVCEAETLSRKEFFETWEVARRIRRRLGGQPVVEMAAGHGFLSMLLMILDDKIPTATCVDPRQTLSHERLLASLTRTWPRLEGRIHYRRQRIEKVALPTGAIVVSVHGCGTITDRVLDCALEARSPVAVLPCCHNFNTCDPGGLTGWLDPALAIDASRAARLSHAGYQVWTTTIPDDITPRNRLLMGRPQDG